VLTRVLITDSVFRGRWIRGDCWVQEKGWEWVLLPSDGRGNKNGERLGSQCSWTHGEECG
jgi:hypothetical protein